MKKFNSLNKSIVSAVALFAEFGSRGEYIRKGKVIVTNDVTDPKREGIFLARLARQIAKRHGAEYAYNWFLNAFTEGVYNRLQARNKEHLTPRQETLSDMRLFGAKALIAIREAQR